MSIFLTLCRGHTPMNAMAVVERWDAALRAGEWGTARDLLTDDATYDAPDAPPDYRTPCATPDEIVAFLRGWKGRVPDVEVVEWAEHGDQVLARLRQPAWGPEAEWYQVLTVRADRIAQLVDYGTEASATAAVGGGGNRRNVS